MSKSNPVSHASQTPAASGNNEAAADRDGNVDKIRDILFGARMRDYERKFVQLEESFSKSGGELREDVKRRFSSLEGFIKGEVETLDGAQKAEKAGREEADRELTTESRDAVKRLEKKIAQVEEENAKALRSLRQFVLDEAKRLGDEISQKQAETASSLARAVEELRGMLTDRHALSDLFAEVSLRLKNDFKLPGE